MPTHYVEVGNLAKTRWGTERDSQRQHVYNWERKMGVVRHLGQFSVKRTVVSGGTSKTTYVLDTNDRTFEMHDGPISMRMVELPVLKAFICIVLRDYGINPRGFRVHDGRRNKSASASGWDMQLPRWSRSYETVCHELAHVLCQRLGKTSWAGHGPQFLRVFLDLLARYTRWNTKALTATARAAHLRITPRTQMPDRLAKPVALS